ncbi:urea active transporter [Dipodascopsis tothii]|uniref:urea active transporter n=1 Tax=Dipodascopsis tothii TaxID=44089 RepID=UPI0034CED002
MTEAPLSQGVGYGIVVGLGLAFAAGMVLTTYLLKRYQNENMDSEEFSTAGRTVKTGLIASAVVSSWTWAATLLQSTAVTYKYGVSGPFWYASGATVQIILFATIAIELKKRAPRAHTFLEVVRARYGPIGHCVFMVFGFCANILVTAMLLTGGSAVVTSLTGMHTVAACFLLPFGVVIYTLFGGIRATFLTDYIHTVVILVIILIFTFSAYATNADLGSPGRVWELLQEVAAKYPVDGNKDGSYLTMRSTEGAIFFVINLVGNFGTVFLDNGYWNKAIAASPAAALPGYIMGGIAWFAIPWLCATTMGLSALALEGNPIWPTYPERMSAADVSAGLVLPNAALALLGKGGAAASLLLIFMAVTSASSAELIAVSSICTYDIYKTYINPAATSRQLIAVSHTAVVAYGLIMAGFASGLYYANVSMGYLYLFMGVIISSAVVPATLTMMWKRQSLLAAALSPVLGLACSLTAWLVTTHLQYDGVLTVETTGQNIPMLAGNVTALLAPVVFVPILTFIKPDNYDWESMKNIRSAAEEEPAPAEPVAPADADAEKAYPVATTAAEAAEERERTEAAALQRASRIAGGLTVFMALALIILWPMPMYGSGYIFSRKFFTGWVVVGIIWIFLALLIVGIYPVWEGRGALKNTFGGILRDLTGRGRPTVTHGAAVATQTEDSSSKSE